MDSLAELLEKRQGGDIGDGVNGIEAKPIDAELGDPVQRILDEEAADLVGMRAVEIQRRTPGGAVPVGEVRAELREVVAFGPEMVVNHVQHHGKAVPVAGVDQALEARRTAVRVLRGERVHAVVAPVAVSGKLRHRHDLESGHAQRGEPGELPDGGIERAFGRKGPDVHFVKDVLFEGQAFPSGRLPVELRRDDLGGGVDAIWLEARCGVGTLGARVEAEAVARLLFHVFDHGCEIAAGLAAHRDLAPGRPGQDQGRLLMIRSPDREGDAAVRQPDGTERRQARGHGRRPLFQLSETREPDRNDTQ